MEFLEVLAVVEQKVLQVEELEELEIETQVIILPQRKEILEQVEVHIQDLPVAVAVLVIQLHQDLQEMVVMDCRRLFLDPQ